MKNFLIVSLFVLLGCSNPSSKETIILEPVAEGQTFNAAFLMIEGVYNSELIAPYDIFQHTIFHTEGGVKVFTVAEKLDTINTFEGLRILPDYSFNSDDLPEIDLLIVPSAEHNQDTDLENEKLISWVKETGEKADYGISLCDGVFVLAKADLAEGRESTTFPSDIDRYKKCFPT